MLEIASVAISMYQLERETSREIREYGSLDVFPVKVKATYHYQLNNTYDKHTKRRRESGGVQ